MKALRIGAALGAALVMAVFAVATPAAPTMAAGEPVAAASPAPSDLWETRITLVAVRPRYIVGQPTKLAAHAEEHSLWFWQDMDIMGGTVDFFDGTTRIGTAETDQAFAIIDVKPPLSVGEHHLSATLTPKYPTLYAPSTSETVKIIVEPMDTWLDVSDPAPDASTFYPVRDAYRDDVVVRTWAYEPIASGSVVVTNAKGKTVMRRTFGASDIGELVIQWSPLGSTKKPLPPGAYRMTVSLADAAGNRGTYEVPFSLSSRQVVWKTAKEVQLGDEYAYRHATDYAWVSRDLSRYPFGVDIFGNTGDEEAEVGYVFSPPKAVAYGKITFDVCSTTAGTGSPGRIFLDRAEDDWVYTTDAEGCAGVEANGPDVIADAGYFSGTVLALGSDKAHVDIRGVIFTVRYAVWKK